MTTRVNLGCGLRYLPDWINIDLGASGPGVIAHDLRQGIPLPSDSCDVVYHSAVFEHFRRADAPAFLLECYRVLRPGGILRLGVPDLERICRLYLQKLEGALAGDMAAAADYEWILLEMYDQTVRERPGGEMAAYLARDPLPNEAFVYERIGEEGRNLVRALRRPVAAPVRRWPRRFTLAGARRRLLAGWQGGLRAVRERLLWRIALSPAERQALNIGRFRLSGEVHFWMYDRYSLAQALRQAGFVTPVLQSPTTSLVPGWAGFGLDSSADGEPVKPDSFFMEAVKPE